MLSELLKKYNLRPQDLNSEELATLERYLKSVAGQAMTVDRIKQFNEDLITAIEKDLAKHDLTHDQDLFLKARLKDRIMMREFLAAPERAKKALEAAMQNLTN